MLCENIKDLLTQSLVVTCLVGSVYSSDALILQVPHGDNYGSAHKDQLVHTRVVTVGAYRYSYAFLNKL
jgi:hypothetical protein